MINTFKSWLAERREIKEARIRQADYERKLTVAVRIVQKYIDQGNAKAVIQAFSILDDRATERVMSRLDHVDRMLVLALIGK